MTSRLVPPLAAACLLAAARVPLAAGGFDQPHLLTLRGDEVTVRYTPGALDRAAHLQERLRTLAGDVRGWLGVDLELRGFVLGPDEWEAAGVDRPYGVPARVGARELAVAAWGDERSVALWRAALRQPLPWGGGEPVRGTVEEAASLALCDLLVQVEVGRIAVAAAGWRGDAEALELAAHVVAASAFALHEPQRRAEIHDVFVRLAERPVAPARRGDGLYFRGAEIVLERDGTRAAKRLAQLARRGKGELRREALIERYPELAPWWRDLADAGS